MNKDTVTKSREPYLSIRGQKRLLFYASGAVFNLVFGVSTAVFLFLFGMPFITKIEREDVVIKIECKFDCIDSNIWDIEF